jgi:hypothetical protein
MGGFVYAIFGSCKDVNIGPTSIMALMLQEHVSKLGPDMAVTISFLAGIIIFILGLLNLGFVVEFFFLPHHRRLHVRCFPADSVVPSEGFVRASGESQRFLGSLGSSIRQHRSDSPVGQRSRHPFHFVLGRFEGTHLG